MLTNYSAPLLLFAALLLPSTCYGDDARALQGVWKPISAEMGGHALPEAAVKAITLRIKKGGYEVTVAGEPGVDQGTTMLDTRSRPKRMTITGVKGPNAGKVFPAIYELKGKRLRICYNLKGTERPSAFKTAAGSMLFLATYLRTKP